MATNAPTHALDDVLAHAYTREEAVQAVLAREDAEDAGKGRGAHELMDEVRAVPTLMLYIPGPLSHAHLEEIALWCRKEISPKLFVEVKVDGARAGGCALAWDGVLYDFSLDYFLEKHAGEYQALVDRTLGAP